MTIKQNVSYIMAHPFFAVAMKDREAMAKLLFEIHFHCYQVVSFNGSREFRKHKEFNDPIIIDAIKNMAPPLNLDIRLPIPEIQIEIFEIKKTG